jgi:hypothetical protein
MPWPPGGTPVPRQYTVRPCLGNLRCCGDAVGGESHEGRGSSEWMAELSSGQDSRPRSPDAISRARALTRGWATAPCSRPSGDAGRQPGGGSRSRMSRRRDAAGSDGRARRPQEGHDESYSRPEANPGSWPNRRWFQYRDGSGERHSQVGPSRDVGLHRWYDLRQASPVPTTR